ncbi:hypothetical protein BT93_C0242 [Corymbia citriodora subsp. variegata]|nr:hypothetical protein BT93_C0242 [Corymbia citriodora subsp. variegata]
MGECNANIRYEVTCTRMIKKRFDAKKANSFLSILNLQSPALDLKQKSSISSAQWAEKSQSLGRRILFQSLRVHMLIGQSTNKSLTMHNFVGCFSVNLVLKTRNYRGQLKSNI